MASTAIAKSFIVSNYPSSLSLRRTVFFVSRSYLHFSVPTPPPLLPFTATKLPIPLTLKIPFPPLSTKPPFTTSLCTAATSEPPPSTTSTTQKRNTKDNSGDSKPKTNEIDKSKLPPPYDPFNKNPAIEEPEDPKNLQEVFHKISSESLFKYAGKMFDGLSMDGLTDEALELRSNIHEHRPIMPDVVVHTAIIEVYANAGQAKEAQKAYMRMLAFGVLPNAYTYSVLIKGLASSGDSKLVTQAKKYVVEMMGKGMEPNAGTCVGVIEGLVKMGREEEGWEFLEELKGKGFAPHEKRFSWAMRDNTGPVVRTVMSILFGNDCDCITYH